MIPSNGWLVRRGELVGCSCLWSFVVHPIDQSTSFPFAILVTSSRDHQAINLSRPKKPALWKGEVDCDWRLSGGFPVYLCFWIFLLCSFCPFVTPGRFASLSDSLSCGDRSDVLFAPASDSVLPSIAFQYFYSCSPVTPCLFRWQKEPLLIKRLLLSDFVWSKKRGTSVHEPDE